MNDLEDVPIRLIPKYKLFMLDIPSGIRKEVPQKGYFKDVEMCNRLNSNSDVYMTVYYIQYEEN
jgi:hypothetical protein